MWVGWLLSDFNSTALRQNPKLLSPKCSGGDFLHGWWKSQVWGVSFAWSLLPAVGWLDPSAPQWPPHTPQLAFRTFSWKMLACSATHGLPRKVTGGEWAPAQIGEEASRGIRLKYIFIQRDRGSRAFWTRFGWKEKARDRTLSLKLVSHCIECFTKKIKKIVKYLKVLNSWLKLAHLKRWKLNYLYSVRPIAKKPKRDVVIQNWLPTDNARKIRQRRWKDKRSNTEAESLPPLHWLPVQQLSHQMMVIGLWSLIRAARMQSSIPG